MKGGIQNCRMCGSNIMTLLKTIGTGSKRGYIDSEEGIIFEGLWFCNVCWGEIIGEKVKKPFEMIRKKLPPFTKKLNVPEIEEEKKWLFDEPICIIEVNENIRRVFKNKPLTRPLATLNKSCKFRERYNMAFDMINEDKIKETERLRQREYRGRPETKAMLKEYYKKYNQRPEVKEKKRKYRQEYQKRPEVKKRLEAYNKKYYARPEVKERLNKYQREVYSKRPEVKQRKKKCQQEYYQKNKKRINKYQKEHYRKNIEREREKAKEYYLRKKLEKQSEKQHSKRVERRYKK